MKRRSTRDSNDDLRPEYDLSGLKGGVRAKYYRRAREGTNLVLIDPAIADAFPGEESVNQALKLLLSAAQSATERVRRTRARSSRKTN